jgi:solute carrier family 25 phosphate transporter 3
MTPIDVVKTRIQIDPKYKPFGFISGTRYLIANEGPSALLTGFGPTAVGYLAQGGAKFAGMSLSPALVPFSEPIKHRL